MGDVSKQQLLAFLIAVALIVAGVALAFGYPFGLISAGVILMTVTVLW